MSPVVVRSRVGKNGVLEINLPLGPGDANRDVQITVEPLPPNGAVTPAEWRAFLDATAGNWKGELSRPA